MDFFILFFFKFVIDNCFYHKSNYFEYLTLCKMLNASKIATLNNGHMQVDIHHIGFYKIIRNE